MLVALRTAPSNTWANPVERVMSIVNTGLQGVGLMRQKMSDEFKIAMQVLYIINIFQPITKLIAA